MDWTCGKWMEGKSAVEVAKENDLGDEILEALEGTTFVVQLSKSSTCEGIASVRCATIGGEEIATVEVNETITVQQAHRMIAGKLKEMRNDANERFRFILPKGSLLKDAGPDCIFCSVLDDPQ